MRKFLPVIILFALISALGFYWFYLKPQKENAPLKLFGNVEIREAEASFRQSGRIKELLVEEGDKVEEGQIIATLEKDTFEEALISADAEIAAINAEVAKLKNGSRPEEIALADANLRQAEAILKNAQTEYARQAALLPNGAVSQKIVEAVKTQKDVAQANYDAALETLKLRKSGFRKEDIESAKSKLEAAKANRQKLNTAYDDTNLYAPVSGIIISKPKEKGAIVTPNLPVFTISMQSPLYIRAYVGEEALGKVAPGTKVKIKSDSIEKEYIGQVGFVSPRSEFTPKTVETENLRSDLVYRLRIIVKDSDSKLLQGMPVTVKLMDEQKTK